MKSKLSSHCGTTVWAAVTTEGKSPTRVCRVSVNQKPVAYSVKIMSGGKTCACPQTPPKSERTLAAGEAVPCALQTKLLSMPFPPFPTAWYFVFLFPRVLCCSYQSSQNLVPCQTAMFVSSAVRFEFHVQGLYKPGCILPPCNLQDLVKYLGHRFLMETIRLDSSVYLKSKATFYYKITVFIVYDLTLHKDIFT